MRNFPFNNFTTKLLLNIKITKKSTKNLGSKVINRQYFHRKTGLYSLVFWVRRFVLKSYMNLKTLFFGLGISDVRFPPVYNVTSGLLCWVCVWQYRRRTMYYCYTTHCGQVCLNKSLKLSNSFLLQIGKISLRN